MSRVLPFGEKSKGHSGRLRATYELPGYQRFLPHFGISAAMMPPVVSINLYALTAVWLCQTPARRIGAGRLFAVLYGLARDCRRRRQANSTACVSGREERPGAASPAPAERRAFARLRERKPKASAKQREISNGRLQHLERPVRHTAVVPKLAESGGHADPGGNAHHHLRAIPELPDTPRRNHARARGDAAATLAALAAAAAS